MSQPNLVVIYVESAPASAKFYADLFGRPPVESSPRFAMFALDSGMMLGVWSRNEVAPAVTATPGTSELVVMVADGSALNALLENWRRRGLLIAQELTKNGFWANIRSTRSRRSSITCTGAVLMLIRLSSSIEPSIKRRGFPPLACLYHTFPQCNSAVNSVLGCGQLPTFLELVPLTQTGAATSRRKFAEEECTCRSPRSAPSMRPSRA
jgi:hypothetical protein